MQYNTVTMEAKAMTQLSLFDWAPIHRASDQPTSVEAAQSVEPKLVGLRLEFVERLRAIGRPATAQEIAGGNESLRKRALECVRFGFVRQAGVKVCEVTGKNAMTYWF
jgi:hypothetical protein